jgi:uncharacterized protein DUF2630
MSDRTVQDHIEALVEEEQRLLRTPEGAEPDLDRHKRLEEVKVELDRCWDLLRQRRALEEFGGDPDDAETRSADTVEHYEQ